MFGIKCIFSGQFEGGETVKEVLLAMLQQKSVDLGVLRIHSKESGIDGDIGIERNTFVVGGRLRGRDERGWDAIKLLLDSDNATFQYLALRDRLPHGLDCGLKIRLTDVIANWPNLPESADKMKCGRESLARIKAYSNKNANAEKNRMTEKKESLLGKLARLFAPIAKPARAPLNVDWK